MTSDGRLTNRSTRRLRPVEHVTCAAAPTAGWTRRARCWRRSATSLPYGTPRRLLAAGCPRRRSVGDTLAACPTAQTAERLPKYIGSTAPNAERPSAAQQNESVPAEANAPTDDPVDTARRLARGAPSTRGDHRSADIVESSDSRIEADTPRQDALERGPTSHSVSGNARIDRSRRVVLTIPFNGGDCSAVILAVGDKNPSSPDTPDTTQPINPSTVIPRSMPPPGIDLNRLPREGQPTGCRGGRAIPADDIGDRASSERRGSDRRNAHLSPPHPDMTSAILTTKTGTCSEANDRYGSTIHCEPARRTGEVGRHGSATC